MGLFDYFSTIWDQKDQPAAEPPSKSAGDAQEPDAQDSRVDAGEAPDKGLQAAKPAGKKPKSSSKRKHVSREVFAAPSSPAQEEGARALDAAFGEGASDSVTQVSAIAQELDQAAVRELYASIASNHASPIKNFIFELKRGTATKEWIEVCRPVMATLIQGAEGMGLPEAARGMSEFDAALALAFEGPGKELDEAARDLLLRGFDEMAQTLPEAFQQGDEERRRETVIIHSLLKQLPDVGHVTFERLYGAGLTTMEALFLASKEDLAATTGIPSWLCERICDRMQEHRREIERARRVSGEGERRERLRYLLEELKRRHAGFEKAASEDWSHPSLADEKREHRQNRQVCALQIEVVLAEMGELELVEQIQKLPFGQRIERLQQYVVSMDDAIPAEVVAGAAQDPAGAPAVR